MSSNMRVGHGHDRHRLESGKSLVLGGVTIEHDLGTVSNSDGDVVIHATVDALLGAVGMGDIGTHFPDTNEEWTDKSSDVFLRHTADLLVDDGWCIINVDVTVFLEDIVLGPHRSNIKATLNNNLHDNPTVNVKFKTGEGVGPVGRGEAVEAETVVLIEKE